MRKTLLSLCITFVGIFAFAAPHQKVEVISGRIIAYSGMTVCLNGNTYWSMVIRGEPHNETLARFFQVDFSYPCEKSPQSILRNPSIQKFHLIRQQELDSTLEENIHVSQQESAKDRPAPASNISKWIYLPGNESFKLPFGEVLPRYYLAELSPKPVI
ncbi:MAG: hypothetical protein ABR976_15565 [Terracidiphilus sp.]|jgi:hypothetical protein